MTEDNRIDQIRAVLDEVDRSGACEGDGAYLASQLTRIRAILDSAPPAPRVFLPGDTVPAGMVVVNQTGYEERPCSYAWIAGAGGPYVESPQFSSKEWVAIVDRASEERAIPEPTEGQNP